MPHGCCCISPPSNTNNNCLSRSAWNLSYLERVDDPLRRPAAGPIRRRPTRSPLLLPPPCCGMNPVRDDHDYQNADDIRIELIEGGGSREGTVRIPFGSEWDPVKIPKDGLPLISDLGVGQPDECCDKEEEEISKARNSLRTVVRKAAGSLLSPPRSPRSTTRSPRPAVINHSDLEALLCTPTTPSGPPADPPQSSHLAPPPPSVPPRSVSPPCHVYQNSDAECLVRDAYASCDASAGGGNVCRGPGGARGGIVQRTGLCSDNIYPQRGSSSTTSLYDSSGGSSCASELIFSDALSDCGSLEVPPDPPSRAPQDCLGVRFDRSPRISVVQSPEGCSLAPRGGPEESFDPSEPCHGANLVTVRARLAACNFYVGQMTADEARARLLAFPEGTFLLRDSSDRRFVFSISVQTARGPTSIRVGYHAGRFHLDSEPQQAGAVPRFDCVLELVAFYTRLDVLSARKRLVLVDKEARGGEAGAGAGAGAGTGTVEENCPVLLRTAYERSPRSLLAGCRRTINRRLEGRSVQRLCLIPSLKDYLMSEVL